MRRIKKWISLTGSITVYIKPNNTFYSKILGKCTYCKLREYQKSGFRGSSFNKKSSNFCLNKLSSKEIYSILIELRDSKPSSQLH